MKISAPKTTELTLGTLSDATQSDPDECDSFDDQRFSGTEFGERTLLSASFHGCELEDVRLADATLRGVHFAESRLTGLQVASLKAPNRRGDTASSTRLESARRSCHDCRPRRV